MRREETPLGYPVMFKKRGKERENKDGTYTGTDSAVRNALPGH